MDYEKSSSQIERSDEDLILQRWMSKKQAKGLTGWQAAERFKQYDFNEYLDVGSGKKNVHQKMIGKRQISTDLFPPADYIGDYIGLDFGRQFPAVWCNHVLEHQLNVHEFLRKIYNDLEIDGVLCITVPPAHPEFMGGHISLWTEGLLVYRLVLAGFDCQRARVGVYDRNISVIVEKKPIEDRFWNKLVFDMGDIEVLAPYFPVPVEQWGDMKFGSVNW
jgi:SAM-dependent methyltransferase